MQRSLHLGSFCLVEGEDDALLYRKFIDKQACRIIIVWGRPKVIEALQHLERESEANVRQRVLAIVDADFWGSWEARPANPSICTTDHHDAELLMLASPVLDEIVHEVCIAHKTSEICQRYTVSDVRGLLLQASLTLGYLRWISSRDALAFDFKLIKMDEFIDRKTLAINVDDLLHHVRSVSRKMNISAIALLNAINEIRNAGHSPFLICNGHDVMRLFSYSLERALSDKHPSEVGEAQLTRLFRLGFSYEYFMKTELFKEIQQWELEHAPYRVLREFAG